MRDINQIIIHCSYTPASMDIGVPEIRQWHLDRNWSDIGYHYVIRRNGVIERGRDEATIGAHVRGQNHDSIGVCLVGGKPYFNFTREQFSSLQHLLYELKSRYPNVTISGHNEHTSDKTCPTFDVQEWFRTA